MGLGSVKLVSLAMLSVLVVTLVLASVPTISAQESSIEDEVVDIIVGESGELISKVLEDIDFGQQNFLNTTEAETQNLKETGMNVLEESFGLALSVKDFASAGVEFASPYEISPFLLTVIGIVVAGLVLFSILRKVAKHFIIMLVIGIVIVIIFVLLGIQT